jgi:hypothetical protein
MLTIMRTKSPVQFVATLLQGTSRAGVSVLTTIYELVRELWQQQGLMGYRWAGREWELLAVRIWPRSSVDTVII